MARRTPGARFQDDCERQKDYYKPIGQGLQAGRNAVPTPGSVFGRSGPYRW